jgi:hypothetical protein
MSKIPSVDQRCLSGWSSSSEEISWFGFGIGRLRGNQNNNNVWRKRLSATTICFGLCQLSRLFWFWLWKFVSSCKFGRVGNLLFDFHVGSSSAIKTTTTFEEKAECSNNLFQVGSAQSVVWFWTLTTTTTKPLAVVPIHARKLELFGLWWGVTGWKLPASSEEAIVVEQLGQMWLVWQIAQLGQRWLVWLWIQDWWTFVVVVDSMEQDVMPDEINEVIKDEYLRVEFLGEKLAEGELLPDRLVGVD